LTNSRGWSRERQDEYVGLVAEFHEDGRYKGREEEVAARIVNKQRAEYGETQAAQDGPSPDEGLPIEHFDRATVDEAGDELDDLSTSELRTVEEFEREHKDRSTLIEQIDRRLDES